MFCWLLHQLFLCHLYIYNIYIYIQSYCYKSFTAHSWRNIHTFSLRDFQRESFGHHCLRQFGLTPPTAGKIRAFINLEQTTTATLNPQALTARHSISARLSVLHLAHKVISLNEKTKMLFILGWSQWKDITGLMGKNFIYCKHSAGECDCTLCVSENLWCNLLQQAGSCS